MRLRLQGLAALYRSRPAARHFHCITGFARGPVSPFALSASASRSKSMATDFWDGKPRMFSSSSASVSIGALKVNQVLLDTVNKDVLAGSGIDEAAFWASLEGIVRKFAPRNKELLAKRDHIQAKIDEWHLERRGREIDMVEYKAFLTSIGYLVPSSTEVTVRTADVDDAIAVLSGPQLVVPVDNARYALNAANARWGSLLDALYGTDVVKQDGDLAKGRTHNVKRAAAVLERTRARPSAQAHARPRTHAGA
jgi:hypothetical protein